MQSLRDGEKRSNLTKFHPTLLFAHAITEPRTYNDSNQARECPTGCGQREVRRHRRKDPKNEIQFSAEADLTPCTIARFSRAGWQRLSGAHLSRNIAPRLRSGLRATTAIAGRTAREHARQVQRRSHGNAKTRRPHHDVRRPWRSRDGAEWPRRQIRCRYFRGTSLAQTQRSSRWSWQCFAEIRHQHPLALRPYR